jgi:hypothetical protein
MSLQKNINLGTQPRRVRATGDAQVLVQNLGPDDLYLGNDASVSSTTGVKLEKDATYTSPVDLVETGAQLWLVSDGASDVRILRVG